MFFNRNIHANSSEFANFVKKNAKEKGAIKKLEKALKKQRKMAFFGQNFGRGQ